MKTPTPALLSVSFQHSSLKSAAETFAKAHQLSCLALHKARTELALNFTELGLEIIDLQQKMTLSVDFTGGALGHRKKYGGGKGQTIARAIGIKQGKGTPYVLDATAGLAKDSFVFACLGCRVSMLERSPVIAALVQDGINRASLNIGFADIINQGFTLHNQDALSYIQAIEQNGPDVIYLDPMYPEKKKSACVKKNMQILQKLLGHDTDTVDVLNAALDKATQRVVVKRPKGARQLQSGRAPTLSYESKATRYDVYIIPS
ncbi:16S rRNA (guanine(1516)-N(2))-methyltransferase [hydrothermal vent metagenome]|uniref:16S rRNA (Guanine(1516)-N(2))-methyltransferase n=1 Tax=hydrothermal vent metagenome TaxID=652676 RepID=A0A3B0XZ82_9ZZZZ